MRLVAFSHQAAQREIKRGLILGIVVKSRQTYWFQLLPYVGKPGGSVISQFMIQCKLCLTSTARWGGHAHSRSRLDRIPSSQRCLFLRLVFFCHLRVESHQKLPASLHVLQKSSCPAMNPCVILAGSGVCSRSSGGDCGDDNTRLYF